jgi:hypothetical protein
VSSRFKEKFALRIDPPGAHPNSLQESEDPAIRSRINKGRSQAKKDARSMGKWAEAGFTAWTGGTTSEIDDDSWLEA